MNQTLPVISIIVPSYNQSRFLEETLKSILDQAYPRTELIVMDGGSTDGSVEILKKYTDQITYWCSEKDNGQPQAIAAGFGRATGDILTYLNSDDLLLPGSLQKVSEAWIPDANQVIYGHHQIIDAEGRVREMMRNPPYIRWIWYRIFPAMPQPGTFFNQAMLKQVGGLDGKLQYAFDLNMFMSFIALHARFTHTRFFMSAFRRHEEQKGRSEKWLKVNRDNELEIRARHPASEGSIHFAKRLNQLLKLINGNFLKMYQFRIFKQGRIKMYHASKMD